MGFLTMRSVQACRFAAVQGSGVKVNTGSVQSVHTLERIYSDVRDQKSEVSHFNTVPALRYAQGPTPDRRTFYMRSVQTVTSDGGVKG